MLSCHVIVGVNACTRDERDRNAMSVREVLLVVMSVKVVGKLQSIYSHALFRGEVALPTRFPRVELTTLSGASLPRDSPAKIHGPRTFAEMGFATFRAGLAIATSDPTPTTFDTTRSFDPIPTKWPSRETTRS